MPALTSFLYHGPTTGLTLAIGAGSTGLLVEHVLHEGSAVDLPAEHPEVLTLRALGRLVLAPAPAVQAAARPGRATRPAVAVASAVVAPTPEP